MENIKLPVKKIRRAQIRYFEKEKNGCDIPDIKAYTYFLELNDICLNIFHPAEECNVYKRLPYPHYNKEGKPCGNKIALINGWEETGVCYILDKDYKLDYPEEYISIEDFENLIIGMDEFIVDRVYIFGYRNDFKTRFKNRKTIKSDNINIEKLREYILSKEKETQKVYKKN